MAAPWLLHGTLAVLALLLVALVLALVRRRPGLGRGRLLDHVEELRRRLLVVAGVLLAGTLAALTIRLEERGGWPVPVVGFYDTLASQLFRAASQALLPPGVQLITTAPADAFVAQFSIALGIGIALAIPVAMDQLARFLAPALRPSEQRLLAWAVIPAVTLFLLGAAFGFVVLLPLTFEALYRFSDALGAATYITVADFATFTLAFLAGCGLAFEMPLVMGLLSRVGLVSPRSYWRKWRHAVVAILVIAMVVTPDPTIVSQVLLAVPLIALYVLGAGLATWAARPTLA
ncbi:MAG TPA: twin-arginine translocase subunit TatC [Candidatus Thermoplasmatota archaeon]|nr:twin-arginine translocase subunit TatC [Candidatus Thermoplasmatota archaeon]